MDPKAKSILLKKLVINGFSVHETDEQLILRPRGMEDMAQVIIKEVEPNKWAVVSGVGRYAGFGRGQKRSYFESYINGWAAEAVLQAAE